ncbi:unnamed protein product [Rotaria magnacalcarata]|uniref:Uncharacterized protein n=1 Tax=Rotaria magnacalcarata TaxID=392030 RepID=A0A816YYY5_9BILA|nr:unnamed protein product [Rotaria magnacalcarata]
MSSADFVAAAKSTKNLSIFSYNLLSEKHSEKFKWEGVSKYNNIEFNLKRTLSSSKRTTTISTLSPLDIEITTWRAFTIGNGRTFQLSNFSSSVTDIVPLEFEDGALSIDNSWKSEESKRRKQIDNSRRFSNEPTATNTQQVNSNDTNDETDDDESSEYDSHIAAQDMADLQQTAKETLKK